ncbi:uncharacterized protein LOC114797006 [Denticeps clupeoides]|uniref:Uncharacterized protein n=1 Tax=Denticeps clupeoides TaxID=299321 RepID=A0AAY4D8K6_9TELE|nr:uncharacterized protein LOC114797006 [Denticeps clupeoides]
MAGDGEPDLAGTLDLSSPYFEVIGGALYRKKLERGFVHYREVLGEERQQLSAIANFHQKRPGKTHHALEDTYRFVAEHYWWEGMYLQVRDFVLGCEECKFTKAEGHELKDRSVSRTVMSYSQEVLSKLKAQQEAGLFCDITLKTGGGHAFYAHKAVLAAVSEYFQEVFTEMDSASVPQSYVDLTGFSEVGFMPLLEFSYTSTLTLRLENLSEVSTMARHLRMWPALEACKAIQREQESSHESQGSGKNDGTSPSKMHGSSLELRNSERNLSFAQKTDRLHCKRKRENSNDGSLAECSGTKRNYGSHSRAHFASDNSEVEETPFQKKAPSDHPQPDGNGFPCSPSRRLKLMDFKSPSSKKKASARNMSHISSSTSQESVRILRSTPHAALALRRLLPKLDSSKGKRKRQSSSFISGATSSVSRRFSYQPGPSESKSQPDLTKATPATPVKVKQEQVEEEVHSPRMQEKYRLLSVLGLQRKSLLPGPEELTGWRQKKRLRKLKVSSYSLTTRRKTTTQGAESQPDMLCLPRGIGSRMGSMAQISSSLSLCDMTRVGMLQRGIKVEPMEPVSIGGIRMGKKKHAEKSQPLLSTVRNTRSKVTLPDLLPRPSARQRERGRRERRHSVPGLEAPSNTSQARARASKPPGNVPKRTTVRIKQEPVDREFPCRAAHVQQRTPRTLPLPSGQRDDVLHTRSSGVSGRTLRYNSRCLAMQVRQSSARGRKKPEKPGSTSAKVERKEFSSGANDKNLHEHPLYRAIKEEPADPLPLSTPLSDPESPELGKRQSKPSVKLLDPGFLFSFCRPTCIKREEESVDICLTRSVASRSNIPLSSLACGIKNDFGLRRRRLVEDGGPALDRQRRQVTRAVPAPQRKTRAALLKVKTEPEERRVTQRVTRVQGHLQTSGQRRRVKTEPPKNLGKLLPLRSRRSVLLESIRRVRLKQLKGRSQAHSCLQCQASYRDCDALVMHRIRHIEGKHWPCPLCSKTFFRQKNVRNHIRTHEPKLYKCRQCIAIS